VGRPAWSPSGAWLVSAVRRDDELAPPIAGTSLTADFDESGRVSGSAGCNRYTAAYTASETELRVSAAASTRMFCWEPPGVMEQEAGFLAALAEAVSFRLADDSLQLLDASGSMLVVLDRPG
jgi:heat shock protein HslJ